MSNLGYAAVTSEVVVNKKTGQGNVITLTYVRLYLSFILTSPFS